MRLETEFDRPPRWFFALLVLSTVIGVIGGSFVLLWSIFNDFEFVKAFLLLIGFKLFIWAIRKDWYR